MDKVFAIATNPVIRTVMMALTGAFLVFFLLIHIIGNYLYFAGADVYNAYSHFLLGLPVIYLIEGCLVLCVLYHAIVGVWSKFRNRREARSQGYAIRRNAPNSRRNLASRTAHITGLFIITGLIIHVATMKFGEPGIPGVERDIWSWTQNMFSQAWIVGVYELVLLILGVHLFHGLGTLYESLGIAHRTWLRRIGQGFAIILIAAYLVFPILVHFVGGNV